MASILRIVKVLEKGFLLSSLLTMMVVMVGSLYGCAPQHQSLRADLLPPEPEVDEHERIGDAYFSQNNLQMALVEYDKSLGLDPDNTRVLYKKGMLFVAGNMNEDAIREFQEVLKREPGHALAHQGIGQVFFQLKKNGDAKKHLHEAVKLEPQLWKAYNILGIIYAYEENYKMAVRKYKAAIAIEPDNGSGAIILIDGKP
jgi:tetratricopeptide (TPR) repeat protein